VIILAPWAEENQNAANNRIIILDVDFIINLL